MKEDENKPRNQRKSSYAELVDHRAKLLSPIFSQDWPNLPTVRAEGLRLYGLDGKRYMDFMARFGAVNTGHNHPKVVAAAREQIEKQIHGAVGVTLQESLLRLADTLPEILPGTLGMFFFGNSGA